MLPKQLKEKILHYTKQKFSPEMMVKKKIKVGISTIYYWFHNGHLGLTKADMLYPRKGKSVKKQASPNFKPTGNLAIYRRTTWRFQSSLGKWAL